MENKTKVTKVPNAKFMYVISAVESAAGMLTAYEHYPQLSYDIFESIKDQENHIDVGILSNAFSEKHDIKNFWKMLKEDNQSDVVLQGDSGGLQVITLGKEITPALKQEIYARQSKYSSEAMCFDEIPLKVLSSGGGILGTVVEYVDSLFRINAIKTGQNIAEQIRIFQNEKTQNAKIMFILQGKDFKTLREWTYFAFREIQKVQGYEDYIEGLAVGVVENLGLRGMADFMLRFQNELEFLPDEWTKKVHVLGAGTISKSITYFIVDDNYFKPGTVISADSTTQTRAMVFGKFIYYDEKLERLISVDAGREHSKESKLVTEKIWNFLEPYISVEPEFRGVCYDSFRNNYTEYNDDLKRKKDEFLEHADYKKVARVGRYFWSMSMVSDFVKYLEHIKTMVLEYDTNVAERPAILKRLKNSLPKTVYKASKVILGLKSYNDYMAGSESEIIVGHPYPTVLDNKYISQLSPDGLVSIKNTLWSTDLDNGVLRGRPLVATSATKDYIGIGTLRGQFLNQLQGNPIDTVLTMDSEKTQQIDIW